MKNGFRVLGLLFLLSLAGCTTMRQTPPLKVGVTPDYPPIITKQDRAIVGLEADFAMLLAEKMGRPLEFVELPWEKLPSALLAGDIDLIMAGMSVTKLREVRIDFCEPYMKSGLMALVLTKDAGRYQSTNEILKSDERIGVKKGTTADVFVQQHCKDAQLVHYMLPSDAVLSLRNRRLEIYIDDAPAIMWFGSKYEADVSIVPGLLTNEELAWGISQTQPDLKRQVNGILEGWKADGTLRLLLKRWVPGMQ